MENESKKQLRNESMASFRTLLEQRGASLSLWDSLPHRVEASQETLPELDEWRDENK